MGEDQRVLPEEERKREMWLLEGAARWDALPKPTRHGQ
jgi:hypothetical protein